MLGPQSLKAVTPNTRIPLGGFGFSEANVRLWHLTDIGAASENVRFRGKADVVPISPGFFFQSREWRPIN